MGRIVAVANQKGGVAKTTSVLALGAAFTQYGLRVLMVDLDPQASLTFAAGIDSGQVDDSVADVLLGEAAADATILSAAEGFDLLPSTIDLAAVESMLLPVQRREFVLGAALADLRAVYDLILLDCAPSLGLLTVNALTAADELLVPMQCEMLSHRGVGQLLDTVADVQRILNPGLKIRGLLPTMYDRRAGHARAVLADIGERYQLPVLAPIPRSVRFAEAPGLGRSILSTARRSAGALAYQEVAGSLLRSWRIRRRPSARISS